MQLLFFLIVGVVVAAVRWMLGTALIVGASNALNMYWERDVDGKMSRTKNRPLPAGRLAPNVALWFGLLLAIVSLPMLTFGVNPMTGLLVSYGVSSASSAPIVFGFVLVFAFALLLVTFRSIVIALKAVVLNLLSVGAAYGLLVVIFQWGWGEGLLGFQSNGGIASWLPIFMFVILFGLSMDYHVFILSRVREAYDRGMKTEDAVAHGITTTAGVVSSAALVMVGAFAVFALMPILDMKEMGIGLAAAVLIDATIVRAVLLPATMKLLGDWNWYLPKWLEWLPRVDHESPKAARAPEAAPSPALGA
jgi:uncharacterized membrane protein YdfJ with MMPL/SSD domain